MNDQETPQNPEPNENTGTGQADAGSEDKETAGGSSRDMDPKLLEVLVCPVTRSTLTYDRDAQELISRAARLAFPIRDGIPIMLPDEARELSDAEANKRP